MELTEVVGLLVAAIKLVAKRRENIPMPIARGGGLGYFDCASFTPDAETASGTRGALEPFAFLLAPA